MLGTKEMALIWNKLIEAEIDSNKDDNNAFNLAQVLESLVRVWRNFQTVVPETFGLVKAGGTIVVTDKLQKRIAKAEQLLPFLDFEAQAHHHIKRYDDRNKLKPILKRVRFTQCEFSLYNPNANLVLSPNVRVRMEVANKLQCTEA